MHRNALLARKSGMLCHEIVLGFFVFSRLLKISVLCKGTEIHTSQHLALNS